MKTPSTYDNPPDAPNCIVPANPLHQYDAVGNGAFNPGTSGSFGLASKRAVRIAGSLKYFAAPVSAETLFLKSGSRGGQGKAHRVRAGGLSRASFEE